MVAGHSIRSVARELVAISEGQDFTAINFIGKQGTGKTEAMWTLSHLIHQFSRVPYKVNYFGRKEMIDLEETVKNLTPMNHIIIMDDIAFLSADATRQQIKQIEYVMSVIRHLPGGKDVRIILMKSFQYSKALPPFLRQNNATFVSSVDDNEIQNLAELLGKKYMQKIQILKKCRVEAVLHGDESYFIYPLGGKGLGCKYKARDPFLPYLYSNQVSCRFVVSPLRTWIDPICPICTPAKSGPESTLNLEQFMITFKKRFGGEGNAKQAVRIKLLQSGVNCYSKHVTNALNYIDEYILQKNFNLEDLAKEFNIMPVERTRLHTKLEFEGVERSNQKYNKKE